MAMNFSLADAEQLSPKNIRQLIIRQIEQQGDGRAYVSSQYFPMYQMGSATEIYHRQSGKRYPMSGSSLSSESPVGGLEGLDEDNLNVTTLKEKISPEKAVDQELNSEQEILNFSEYVANALREDMAMSRSMMAWREWNGVPGMIGADGLTAHPEVPTSGQAGSHIIVPGTAYSDTANATPHTDFMEAQKRIELDGTGFNNLPPVTAVMSPSVFWDLKNNDALEQRFSGVRVQSINTNDDLSTVLPINIDVVRTRVPRLNSGGEPVDDTGSVVDVENAAFDNILEPHDGTNTNRNVVVGTFGQEAALMPWLTDRLSDFVDNTPPGGDWSVDANNGHVLQRWTQHDPAISWIKMAQEIGLEVLRGENFTIIQGV